MVNDFGRNSLYRNNGNGTFTAISAEAEINEPGAGMSACWLDYDNDGKQDIYCRRDVGRGRHADFRTSTISG